jgi:hypothetical protein
MVDPVTRIHKAPRLLQADGLLRAGAGFVYLPPIEHKAPLFYGFIPDGRIWIPIDSEAS